jgi:hypothetical protein
VGENTNRRDGDDTGSSGLGKSSLTDRLVQRESRPELAPGKRAHTDALVQRRADGDVSGEAVQDLAAQGTAGTGGALPHGDRIQQAFGRHDVSDVSAHTDDAAAAAARGMGAEAFATGNQIAFAGDPSLHTAAHEAAHVVQQRGGVQLKGGVGEAGDRYEQHADAVADQVVAGKSAEPLLDQMAGGSGAAGVQRKAIAAGTFAIANIGKMQLVPGAKREEMQALITRINTDGVEANTLTSEQVALLEMAYGLKLISPAADVWHAVQLRKDYLARAADHQYDELPERANVDPLLGAPAEEGARLAADENRPTPGPEGAAGFANLAMTAPKKAVTRVKALGDGAKPLLAAVHMLGPNGDEALEEMFKQGGPNDTVRKRLIEARFGVTKVSGAWIDEGLDRVWNMFKLVPEWHTSSDKRANPSMKEVKGKRSIIPGASSYDPTNKVVELDFHRGSQDNLSTPTMGLGTAREGQVMAGQKFIDSTILHEVGHAVDEQLGIMNTNMGKPEFGGWHDYGAATLPVAAEMIAERQTMAAPIAGPDVPAMTAAVSAVVGKASLKTALKANNVERYKEDPIFKAVEDGIHLGLMGSRHSRPNKAPNQFGARVFHKAYSQNWVSYTAAARDEGVSEYQFRAPAEFFAEVYAAKALGVLPAGHPLAAYMEKIWAAHKPTPEQVETVEANAPPQPGQAAEADA